jgi:DNA-binding CsgD family transcriptional regulator
MARAALAGASGFFEGTAGGRDLDAIRTAGRVGWWSGIRPRRSPVRVREPERMPAGPPPLDMTERQREVLALMAEGMDPRAIARTLGISLNTSRGHIKAVMAKLGAHSQLEAVVEAMHLGLLSGMGPGPGTEGGPESRGGPGRDVGGMSGAARAHDAPSVAADRGAPARAGMFGVGHRHAFDRRVNDTLERITGYERKELVGRSVTELTRLKSGTS